MNTRTSLLLKNDISWLNRLISKAQVSMIEWAVGGFKDKGFGDDQMAIVDLIVLRDAINKILERRLSGGK